MERLDHNPQRIDSVRTSLLYLSDPGELDRDDATGWPGRSTPHEVTISNGRVERELSLDRNGFLLIRHESAVKNFYDEREVRAIYYPELARLLTEITGAAKVVVFAHDVRSADKQKQDGKKVREPVSSVHNDYTPKSAPQMVMETIPANEAQVRLGKRFVEINIWRPIKGPVLDAPLAICDARSIAPAELVGIDRYLKHEVYMMRFSPAHRWFYFPRMAADETILIKGFDSICDGRARFTAHAAFIDPVTLPDAPPRESIEARALLFFD
jgi:hypothetical protein